MSIILLGKLHYNKFLQCVLELERKNKQIMIATMTYDGNRKKADDAIMMQLL